MKRLSGGIDIGRSTHHMINLDEKGEILYQKTVSLSTDLQKNIIWIK